MVQFQQFFHFCKIIVKIEVALFYVGHGVEQFWLVDITDTMDLATKSRLDCSIF